MGVKDRLDLVIKYLDISGRAFSKQCGFSESYYSTINDGIGADKLNKILSNYPEISAHWLITGEGEMLLKKEENFAFVEKMMEKFSDALDVHKNEYNVIVGQNGRIIEQNGEIIKQNSEILSQNAEVIRQNTQLMRQNSEAMALIQKLSEKLK